LYDPGAEAPSTQQGRAAALVGCGPADRLEGLRPYARAGYIAGPDFEPEHAVLEHLRDDGAAVAAIAPVMRPGGLIVITVPA
jgi:hypothetical protein